jgi:hypothetical protein
MPAGFARKSTIMVVGSGAVTALAVSSAQAATAVTRVAIIIKQEVFFIWGVIKLFQIASASQAKYAADLMV